VPEKKDLYDRTVSQWRKGRERGSGIPAKIYDVISFVYKEDYRPIVISKYLVPVRIEDAVERVVLEMPRSVKEVIRRARAVEAHENETWFFVINLPSGIPFENFKKLEQTFADALGENGTCQIEQRGLAVHLRVSNVNRTKTYPYEFDPTPYLKKGMLLPFPVGYSINGLIVKDLAEMLTLLIVGMMGSGKSNMEHVLIYTLLLLNSMNGIDKRPVVIPVMCDPKLGEFQYLEKYGLLWAKDPKHIEALLKKVNEENDRRALIVGPTGARNFPEFLKLEYKMPAIVVFCDEMGELTKEAYESFHRLLHVGRSQGIFTVGAIQRPSAGALGKIGSFPELKAMFDANLVYRVKDATNSNMILGNSKAAFIPKLAKGRCIYDWDEEITVQSMFFPSIVSDSALYESLLSKLIQFPSLFSAESEGITNEESKQPFKGLLPRFKSAGSPRALHLLEYGSNPFT